MAILIAWQTLNTLANPLLAKQIGSGFSRVERVGPSRVSSKVEVREA